MRRAPLLLLALLTACSSAVPEARRERRDYFEEVVRVLAGPGATDCGTTGPRFPSDDVRQCAAGKLNRRDPFFAIRYEQGIDSELGTGWILDEGSRLLLVDYDDRGCRTAQCGVIVSECSSLEILQEWEWFRAGGCKPRPLPEVPPPGGAPTGSDAERPGGSG